MTTWTKDKAPVWAKDAIATDKGWTDPKTGEILVAVKGLTGAVKHPGVKGFPDKVTPPNDKQTVSDDVPKNEPKSKPDVVKKPATKPRAPRKKTTTKRQPRKSTTKKS